MTSTTASPRQTPSAEIAPDCPYVGLVPFTEADAAYFFGRERDTDVIVANLTASRLTLLYAASGVGKSSVLRAGVVPSLRALSDENVDELEIPGNAIAYVSQWSSAPLQTVASAVLEAVEGTRGARPVDTVDRPELGVPWLADVLRQSGVSTLYLLLDQFEEHFLYQPPGEDDVLGTQLGEILRARDLPVHVLVSIREDALAALDRFKGRIPHLFDNYLRLGHLDTAAARNAVERPLDHYNAVVPPGRRMSIEPGLVSALLDQVRAGHLSVAQDPGGAEVPEAPDGRGHGLIETPYLQLVLARLWEEERAAGSSRLRAETLHALGGAQTIVQTHLDDVMARLRPEQVEVAASVFHHLVTRSGSKIALSPDDLADWADLSPEPVHDLLESLSSGSQRILRPVAPAAGTGGPPRYEIFHDVMGAAVLDWRRRYVTERRHAEEAARLVAEREHAEATAQAARRRLRTTRLVAVAMACLLLLASVLGFLAYQSGRQVEQRALLSEAAQVLGLDPGRSLQQAVAAYEIRSDPTAQEAVLTAASRPSSRTLLGPADGAPIVGMADVGDGRTRVAYDRSGGVFLIDDQGGLGVRGRVSGLAGSVVHAAASPDAARIAVGTDRGEVAVLDTAGGGQTVVETGVAGVLSLAWMGSSSDGMVLVTATPAEAVIASGTTGQVLVRVPDAFEAMPTADGQHVVTAHDDRLRVWDARSGLQVAESAPVYYASFLRRTGDAVVAFTPFESEQAMLLWDWRAGPVPVRHVLYYAFNSMVDAIVDEASGTVRVATDKDATVYSLRTGELLSDLPDHPDWVYEVGRSADGNWLATAGGDGQVLVWFVGPGSSFPDRPTYVLAGHAGGVLHVGFVRGSAALVSVGIDGTVRLWELPAVQRFAEHLNWVVDIDLSEDGEWVVTAGFDNAIYVARTANIAAPSVAAVDAGWDLVQVEFDPADHHRVFALTAFASAPTLYRWTEEGYSEWLSTFEHVPTGSWVKSIAVSPDGTTVTGTDSAGVVRTWDVATGRLLPDRALHGSPPAPRSVAGRTALDPAGRLLAVTVPAGVELWDLDGGGPPRLLAHEHAAWIAFDSAGDRLVSAAEGGVLRVWDREGKLVRELDSHGGRVGQPAFAPDGRLLAVGTTDGLLQVWDLASGATVMLQRHHSEAVNDVVFVPGGSTRLITASDDHTVAQTACAACDDKEAATREAVERGGG